MKKAKRLPTGGGAMCTLSYTTRHCGPTIMKKGVSVLVGPLPEKVRFVDTGEALDPERVSDRVKRTQVGIRRERRDDHSYQDKSQDQPRQPLPAPARQTSRGEQQDIEPLKADYDRQLPGSEPSHRLT